MDSLFPKSGWEVSDVFFSLPTLPEIKVDKPAQLTLLLLRYKISFGPGKFSAWLGYTLDSFPYLHMASGEKNSNFFLKLTQPETCRFTGHERMSFSAKVEIMVCTVELVTVSFYSCSYHMQIIPNNMCLAIQAIANYCFKRLPVTVIICVLKNKKNHWQVH